MPSDPAPQGVITVRELRWDDFPDLTESYYRLYDEREEGVPIGIHLFEHPPDQGSEAGWFSGLYQKVLSGETICRIGEIGGHAVGSCQVGRVGSRPDQEMGHVGELGILVHRDYRARGVGEALLRETLAACRGKFDLVRLAVFTVNERAIALYRRFGFTNYGRQPAAVRRGSQYFDLDLMVLDLRDPPAKG